MGFDFNSFIAQFSVAFIILIFITSANLYEINGLIDGIKIESSQMVKLLVNVLLFVFISSIFLISGLKKNVLKIINAPFEYSLKLIETFMK
ncbi:MAG: hypothetical protein PHT91_00780 [Candidatus Nanoarchaeia archaeon]|nr:hypothetical protein [Candidatus Nanoarchaeia archaeon]MDD5054498.1 hypothetical protein [Candidatus Nanoarchaeia archaeon]MDD5499394.1 hypothetical protein [Candidatus Nanoarchaeia archaeon]